MGRDGCCQPPHIGEEFCEGLCHHHRRSLWPGHCGAYLACHRGRAAPGDGPLVRSHNRCGRRSQPLGLARALALVALVTSADGGHVAPSLTSLDSPRRWLPSTSEAEYPRSGPRLSAFVRGSFSRCPSDPDQPIPLTADNVSAPQGSLKSLYQRPDCVNVS